MRFLKRFFFYVLLFIGIAVNAENSSVQQVSVQLEWKHQFEFAGFYAALDQGYYREMNLDVEIKEYHPAIDTVHDVLTGRSTYGMSSSQLILERLSGKKIVQLASYLKQNALVLITKPSIKSVSDLKNRRVMASKNELESTSLAAMMHESGLGIEDLEVVPHTFNIDAFLNGDVDAMTAFVSNQPFLLDQKEVAYNVLNPAEEGIYSYDVELFTSEYEADSFPTKTQNFINATRRGWEYALAHKEEIVELIYTKYSKEKTKEALLYEADVIESLMKTDLFQIGAVVPELIELNTNMYVQLGMAANNWNLDGFVFGSQPKQINFTQQELAFIKKHPVIRFSDVEWPPFASIKESEYSGIFKEYYRLLEQRTGMTFEFVKVGDGINFQNVLDALEDKKIDMIDGTGKTVDRERYALFAGPLMQVSLATASNKINRFTKMTDLLDKRVVVAKGSTASEYIKEKFPEKTLLYTGSIDEALEMVRQNSADVLLDNSVVLDYMIESKGYSDEIDIASINDYEFNIYALIRDDYPMLQQIINKAVKSITQEELLRINNKLLQATIRPTQKRTLFLTAEEKQYLSRKKVITMCVDPDRMPFEKIEEGRYIGLAADYMQMISQKIHMPISLVETDSWRESLQRAVNRECDILPMVARTDKKGRYWDFTSAYIETPLVIATKHDQLYIDDLSDYMDKKWGVVKGYSVNTMLKKRFPGIDIVEVDSISQGLKEVEKGTLFGCIDNSVTLSHAIQKEFLGTVAITGRLEDKVQYSIATRNDEPTLQHVLEKAVLSIDLNSRQQMLDKWVKVQYPSKTDYTLVWQVLVVTFLIILIVFYRSVLLKREVVKRKEAETKLQKFTVTLSQKIYDATVDLEEKNLKLVESVYNFEDIFNTTMEMIVIFDDDGTIIDINRSGLKMLGYYYKSEVVGSKISIHILESELPKVYEDLRMDTHEPYALVVLKRDGSQLHTLKSSRRIIRDGKKVRLATLMDLTEVREQNSHLIQQSKMAAMGEMIENIAHQWRQPLSQINSAVLLVDGLLDQKDVEDEQIEAKLSEIEELTKYMSTTINDFKDFFIQEKKIVSFVLSDVVEKAVKISRSSLKNSQIDLTFTADEEIILNGYPNELQQVILVLINNAKEALINRKTAEPKVLITVNRSEEYFRVTVCDNAGGVEEEFMDKIFDPYFTTKHQSQGTGLGLYISKMIIQDSMHGTLEVQNSEEGACFTILLNTD